MSTIKTVLAGVGLAAVGYGVYKGAQYLAENTGSSSSEYGDEVYAIIEKARAEAEAELEGQQLDEPMSAPNTFDGNAAPVL